MRRLQYTVFLLVMMGCNNLLDADLTTRQTFIKNFNTVFDMEAVAMDIAPDGYYLLGNMPDPVYARNTRDSVITVVLKTDLQGRLIAQRFVRGIKSNGIKVIDIAGDYQVFIAGETNPKTENNTTVISSRILRLDNNLANITATYNRNYITTIVLTYRALSLTVTTDNKLVVLGSYRNTFGLDKPYVEQLSLDLGTSEWFQDFTLDVPDRSYRNAHAVHFRNGQVIWASAISRQQNNAEVSWLSIPFAERESSLSNSAVFGENDNLSIRPADIQPALQPQQGFGVIGTRANQNSTGANIFYLRTDIAGNIIPNTIRYYDGGALVDAGVSNLQDFGGALTATTDGGFLLAGHFVSTPTQGNGLEDIVLMKIDLAGNLLWSKTMGGTGGETVSAVRETEDQGLLIFGTNTVQGVSSAFLIKTDRNGELKN